MIYEYDLTVPANTPKNAQVSQDCKLAYGVIHYLGVQFPTGCVGLVHVHINDAIHQVFPTNPDGTFKGDGVVIEGRVLEKLYNPPFILTLWGWNLDDTYDHTVTVRFWIIEPHEYYVFSEASWEHRGF